jgi:predicted transcriptional regulator
MSDTVKLTANLSRAVANALKELAERRGVSMTEMLRLAISHEKFFQDAVDQNEKILLRDPNGNYDEIILK